VVKSHGSADRLAFATALARAHSEASHDLLARIAEEVTRLHAAASGPAPVEAA
jgi:fatty acid/phospholipid biosynthesis enzyme